MFLKTEYNSSFCQFWLKAGHKTQIFFCPLFPNILLSFFSSYNNPWVLPKFSFSFLFFPLLLPLPLSLLSLSFFCNLLGCLLQGLLFCWRPWARTSLPQHSICVQLVSTKLNEVLGGEASLFCCLLQHSGIWRAALGTFRFHHATSLPMRCSLISSGHSSPGKSSWPNYRHLLPQHYIVIMFLPLAFP